jgi:glyoxylase I family protein
MPAPLPIIRLHHIARVTSKPEESIAFYCNVLGFRELPRPPFSFRGAWLYNYDVQIHIIENLDLATEPDAVIDTRANHLAFSVTKDDIQVVKSLLDEHGIAFSEQVNAGGIQQIFFRDPDGHHVEISVTGEPSVGYVSP